MLYDLGFIPRDAPLETIRQRYAITDTIVAIINQPNFSQQLRQSLQVYTR